EQRRLAAPVQPDDPEPVVVADREGHVREQGAPGAAGCDGVDVEEDHRTTLRRGGRGAVTASAGTTRVLPGGDQPAGGCTPSASSRVVSHCSSVRLDRGSAPTPWAASERSSREEFDQIWATPQPSAGTVSPARATPSSGRSSGPTSGRSSRVMSRSLAAFGRIPSPIP